MRQGDFVANLKDAFLAGFYLDSPLGTKKVCELTAEEEQKTKDVEAAAYKWAHGRMSLRLTDAEL